VIDWIKKSYNPKNNNIVIAKKYREQRDRYVVENHHVGGRFRIRREHRPGIS
jgi:hypothetical protein